MHVCSCSGPADAGAVPSVCIPLVEQDILFGSWALPADPWSRLRLATRVLPRSSLLFPLQFSLPSSMPTLPGALSWTGGCFWSLALSLWEKQGPL